MNDRTTPQPAERGERPARPGEKCGCGRQAVTVYITNKGHEAPYCGIPDGGATRQDEPDVQCTECACGAGVYFEPCDCECHGERSFVEGPRDVLTAYDGAARHNIEASPHVSWDLVCDVLDVLHRYGHRMVGDDIATGKTIALVHQLVDVYTGRQA